MFFKKTIDEKQGATEFTITSYLGGLVTVTKGRYGGTTKFFGFPVVLYYEQESFGWFNQWVFTIPFVFALRRINDKNGTLKTLAHKPAGWSISFAKLRVSIRYQSPEVYQ